MSPKPPLAAEPVTREHRLTLASAAIAGATLATFVLITADAVSVFQGESLPQVLLMLLSGVVASFGSIPFWPDGARYRLNATRFCPDGTRWRPKVLLLTALVGWLLLSTASATWYANGRAAWNGCWHVIGLLIFGLVLHSLCRHAAVSRAVAQIVIMGAIALSVHAMHQRFVSMPETRAAYEQDPEKRLAELNIDAPPGSAMRAQYESRLYSSEPMATFALTNSLAVLLSGALVALSIWIAHQLRSAAKHRLSLMAAGLAWALIAATWLLTKSRAAWLSVMLVAAVCAWLWWRARRISAIPGEPPPGSSNQGAIVEDASPAASPLGALRGARRGWIPATGLAAAVVFVFAAFVALLSRDSLILSEAPKSIAYRLEYWQASSKMILDHALTGVGLGNFQSYYPRYKSATASEIIADPHNWVFDIAATCSLPALALLLIGLAMATSQSWSSLTEPSRGNGPQRSSDGSSMDHASALERQLVKALWIGAATGWTLTVMLQWLLHEAIDLEASLLGIVVSIVGILSMRSGPQPHDVVWRGMGLAAATTMIVCLLASGSWQASGLALPLAAWLGVSAPPVPWSWPQISSAAAAKQVGPAKQVGQQRRQLIGGRIMAIVALLSFVAQDWRPVNMSWTHYESARAALDRGDLGSAREAAMASVAADPLDPNPRRLLLQVLASEASEQSREQFELAAQRVEAAIAELLACDPAAAGNWAVSAETLVSLAAEAEELSPSPAVALEGDLSNSAGLVRGATTVGLLERADEHFRGAVERYPSNVAWHAQRAAVLSLLGQRAASQLELKAALELSEATPHLDRKLAMQQIWLPPPLTVDKFPPSAIVRPSPGSPWVQAEPLCDFLRTH